MPKGNYKGKYGFTLSWDRWKEFLDAARRTDLDSACRQVGITLEQLGILLNAEVRERQLRRVLETRAASALMHKIEKGTGGKDTAALVDTVVSLLLGVRRRRGRPPGSGAASQGSKIDLNSLVAVVPDASPEKDMDTEGNDNADNDTRLDCAAAEHVESDTGAAPKP